MYLRRLQLVHYGPINNLDIKLFPKDDKPKPLVLVGGNGSGKSIVLSHIVNGIIGAKSVTFPESSEVEQGKVYKLRSSTYITSGHEYYYARVDFEDDYTISELRTRMAKQQYTEMPSGISNTPAQESWDQMDANTYDHYQSTASPRLGQSARIKDSYKTNCVLYFPANRFEEPAWLNEENLTAQAQHLEVDRMSNRTSRRVIASSPLYENQNWLYDVLYDRSVFELQTQTMNFPVNQSTSLPLPVLMGFSGDSANLYEIILSIIRLIIDNPNARLGIGKRNDRVISVESDTGQIAPNIFQLSTGETSLLNLCLSILRDFDLSEGTLSAASDIRGVVVVDEIDLHLHVKQQYEVLPQLLSLFPKVQFILTTHSPLFVLGMERSLGTDGFALYRLPDGTSIEPEEFGEFGNAYTAFTDTQRFAQDTKEAIEGATRPLLYVEGDIDCEYIRCAAQLLNRTATLGRVELRDGGGAQKLHLLCKSVRRLNKDIVSQPVVVLFDSDTKKEPFDGDKLSIRTVPFQADTPVKKGIENLFERQTLEDARAHKVAFIDVDDEHAKMIRGVREVAPEVWRINADEKRNLCTWICGQNIATYFARFDAIFDIIDEVLDTMRSNESR